VQLTLPLAAPSVAGEKVDIRFCLCRFGSVNLRAAFFGLLGVLSSDTAPSIGFPSYHAEPDRSAAAGLSGQTRLDMLRLCTEQACISLFR